MSVAIDTSEIDRLAKELHGAERIIDEEMLRGMQRVALQVEASAKSLAPVQTGNLRRSITKNVTAHGQTITARIGTNVPYARYVEEGRGPIEAGPGKVLRFEIGGQVFYRKRVGPARARPYMKPALIANRAKIVREFQTVVPRRIVQRVGLS